MVDRREERGQATRQHIVLIATRLFTEEGYEGTSIERVLQAGGISRGALYHHFASKEALFAAVLEEVEARVAAQVRTAAQGAATPLSALRAGCAAWLALARDPTVRQVVLIDAPAVVGWQAWREIDDRHALDLLRGGLEAASVGRADRDTVELSAHMLLAVLVEVALLIARADDAVGATQAGQDAVDRLLPCLTLVDGESEGHQGIPVAGEWDTA